jgi:hypothetical protein
MDLEQDNQRVVNSTSKQQISSKSLQSSIMDELKGPPAVRGLNSLAASIPLKEEFN